MAIHHQMAEPHQRPKNTGYAVLDISSQKLSHSGNVEQETEVNPLYYEIHIHADEYA